jgi:hypothetical protein
MKNKIKLRNFILVTFISFFGFTMYEAKGQFQWQPPRGEINMFNSSDTTIAAIEYNSLNTKEQRDSLIRARLDQDWTHTIPPEGIHPYFWVCGNFVDQLTTNSHDWGDGVVTTDEKLLFDGYRGNFPDSIYMCRGTLLDIGKLGLPLWNVSIYDPITILEGHGLCAILTGDDLTRWEDWNFIEVQSNTSNVVPGGQTYMPRDCEHVLISYSYITINQHGQKLLCSVMILEFKLKDGIPILTYNVNDGTTPPNYTNNPHFDKIFHVITQREDIPSTSGKKITPAGLQIYPNPAVDRTIFSYSRTVTVDIEIFSPTGELILRLHDEDQNGESEVHFAQINPGMYIYRMIDSNGMNYTGKLIKQ